MLRCFSRRAILAVLTSLLCAGVFPLPAQESSPPRPRITAYKTYGRPITVAVGVNQKRQVNLNGLDGTRVELMEPNTVTGKPTPSSTAPPPPPAHD